MDEILNNHIANNFDTSAAGGNMCEKLLSTNIFMVPIAVFIQCRTIETVSTERIATKMEKHANTQILDADMNHVTKKLVLSPNDTDSAPRSSLMCKRYSDKSDSRRPEHRSSFRGGQRWDAKV